jgi:NAD(P)-dependent dehydrogenase (short-subunit alcohol dehydrogenase family)
METIRGKRALVTGAASGIGRAIALALAREGADLFLVDIDESNLRASACAAEKFKSRVVVAVCDLSQTAQVTATVNACRASFGGLDILVNSAGIVHYGPADEMTTERWNAVMSVNLSAPIQLVRELLPSMIEQNESHILNVCSVLGLVPGRKLMAYQTSKFALVGFSLALRTEVGAQNVGVTAFCPGLVDTPMMDRSGPGWLRKSVSLGPLSLIMSPDAVARRAISSIRGDRGLVVVSWGGQLIWRIYRLFPALVLWLFRGRCRASRNGSPIDR